MSYIAKTKANNSFVIKDKLLELSDEKYKLFQLGLMPGVPCEKVIGVRIPLVRNFAKEIKGTPEAYEFMSKLPHEYYDEDNLHGVLISMEKDHHRASALLDDFLPFVDNWATCDLITPKIFAKHREELLQKIWEWIESGHTYTVRFGIEMLLKFYLDEGFAQEQADAVASLRSGEYYINMVRAWYFATALAKQYDKVIPYIENRRLDEWTHNMTIRKAIESYRISDDKKAYLRKLRI